MSATGVPMQSDYAPAASLDELNSQLPPGGLGWPRFTACPICESVDIRSFALIRQIAHDRCRRCGFTFANPYPPQSVLDAFYDSVFYTNYRHLEDRRRRNDPYFSASMYTDMRALARLVASRSPASVLDYGCGTGSFLALLRDEFEIAAVEGLEISAQARERGRTAYGLEIAGGPDELKNEAYDFVLLLEVIEHIPDPTAFFANVASLVRPGGFIMITTPAVDNLIGRYMPRHCLHYTAPSHVSLFTTAAIRELLQRFSLRPVHMTTDPAIGVARTLALSALYSLDFASPQHDGDRSDAIYRPTAIGRWLGQTTGRGAQPPTRPLSKALTVTDRVVERVVRRPDHFYIIAEQLAK